MARFLNSSANKRTRRSNIGFTLIDALISLLVISVSLTALLKLHWQVTRNSLETQMHNIALNLAQQKMAELHSNAAIQYDLINTNNDSVTLSHTKLPLKFNRQWQVQDVQPMDYKLITLTITWKFRLSSRQLNLRSIVGKP